MTGRTLFSICFAIFVVVFGILFIWGIDAGLQRIEKNKDICSEHNMSSIVMNRAKVVLCVDNKGQLFYLRERNVE